MEKHLEIAQTIGEPINTQLPVPVEVAEIADVFVVNPGEKVWRYTGLDETADVVLDVDANGEITVVKRSPLGDAELTFKGLNSKLEYVLVDAIIGETDLSVLSRRKESIAKGMDKRELSMILTAILANTGSYLPGKSIEEVVPATGDDLYDVILAMKHKVEDYGDNFVLLVGTTVKEKIDTYDKENAGTFNYNVTLSAKLAELGIKVMKVFGQVADDAGETKDDVMDKKKMILIAKNSRISEGKPIKFVRRRISPEIAKLMGADVDRAQRAIVVSPTPVNVAGVNTLGYGVYGYESIIFTITNPLALCICDATTLV